MYRPMSCENNGAPGMIRTCDTGFRRAVLYPLSYGGGDGSQLTEPAANSVFPLPRAGNLSR